MAASPVTISVKAVAIDSDTVVIGANNQDFDAAGGSSVTDAGAAYVFKRSGVTWSLEQKLVGTGTNGRVADDDFGCSVAISTDRIAIGACNQDYDATGANASTDSGAVYVYTRSGSTWSVEKKIVATGTNGRGVGDQFGNAVSVSGTKVALGAPYHSYDANGADYSGWAGAVFVHP